MWKRAFGSAYSAQYARRTSYHSDKLRPRLSPFGLLIRAVTDHGRLLLRERQEPDALFQVVGNGFAVAGARLLPSLTHTAAGQISRSTKPDHPARSGDDVAPSAICL